MEEKALLELAKAAGFTAALCETADIPVDHSFRRYCEENLCGQYDKNYGCPPRCGSPEAMEQKLRSHRRALVLQTAWPITDYTDYAAIAKAKAAHNAASVQLLERLTAEGHTGMVIGSSGCTLCEACARLQGEPCRYPAQQYACMSAYCVFVMGLAQQCGIRYDCEDGMLRLFGMLIFDESGVKNNFQKN